MPTMTALEDLKVLGAKNKILGTITHVLFHPSESRVIGVELRPPALGYVIDRPLKYYAYDALDFSGDELTIRDMKAVSGSAAAKRLEIDWDHTVIWHYQDVVTVSGERMGQVSEVDFTREGIVRSFNVSGGATADVAIGRHTVEADHIVGFDGDVIRVKDIADARATSGGIAAQAGKGTAVAKHAAKKAAAGALKGGIAAARVAKKSKTAKRMGSGWRSFADSYKEGLKDDRD